MRRWIYTIMMNIDFNVLRVIATCAHRVRACSHPVLAPQ
jgi:hypothetical protein